MLLPFATDEFKCDNPIRVWVENFANRPNLWKPHESPDYVWEAGGTWFLAYSPLIQNYPSDGLPYLLCQWGNFDGAWFRFKPTVIDQSCDQRVEFIGRMNGVYGPGIYLRRNGENNLFFYLNSYWGELRSQVIVGGNQIAYNVQNIEIPNNPSPYYPRPTVLQNGQLFRMLSEVKNNIWTTQLDLLETGQTLYKCVMPVPDWPGEPWLEAWAYRNQQLWIKSARFTTGPKSGFETRPGARGRIGRILHGNEDNDSRKQT